RRSTAHRYIFAEHVAVAGDQLCALAVKFQILRVRSYRAKRVKYILFSEARRSVDHRVLPQNAAFPELHFIPDDRVCAYLDACAEFRAWRDHRMPVNRLHRHLGESSTFTGRSRSIILHITVPSAASWPLTVALPSSLQKSPRQESTVVSRRSWSPGTTGRRKRAPSTATKYSSLFSRSGISCNSRMPPN